MEPINETTARQLLERYQQGETSLAEEKQLSLYFCQAQLPNDLLPYRALFLFFQAEAAVMPPEPALRNPLRLRRNYLRFSVPFAAAAAGIILFFALYRPFNDDFVCYQDGKRIRNQEVAMQLAQQQWEQISVHIEKATAMVDILEQMRNYTEIINKYIPK